MRTRLSHIPYAMTAMPYHIPCHARQAMPYTMPCSPGHTICHAMHCQAMPYTMLPSPDHTLYHDMPAIYHALPARLYHIPCLSSYIITLPCIVRPYHILCRPPGHTFSHAMPCPPGHTIYHAMYHIPCHAHQAIPYTMPIQPGHTIYHVMPRQAKTYTMSCNRMASTWDYGTYHIVDPATAQASLRICTVSPEPSLFAYTKYGIRRRVRRKIRHLAPLDGCACVVEKWVYGWRKVP